MIPERTETGLQNGSSADQVQRLPESFVKRDADIIADIAAELRAYREGGVTEEILRRNDGCIKVGHGCAIVPLSEWNGLKDLKNNLRACPDPISRDRADHLAPSEIEYYTQDQVPHGTFTCANCGLIARWELSASERATASRELA